MPGSPEFFALHAFALASYSYSNVFQDSHGKLRSASSSDMAMQQDSRTPKDQHLQVGMCCTGLPCRAMWRIARLAENPDAPSKRFGASPYCHLPGAGMLASRAPRPPVKNLADVVPSKYSVPDTRQEWSTNILAPDSRVPSVPQR